MSKLWMAVAPASRATRVIALHGHETSLKAHLNPTPRHCRALPWLLEAIALWQGEKVHAVLCADGGVGTAVTSFYRDWFDDFADLCTSCSRRTICARRSRHVTR
jgi:hypothetical protein